MARHAELRGVLDHWRACCPPRRTAARPVRPVRNLLRAFLTDEVPPDARAEERALYRAARRDPAVGLLVQAWPRSTPTRPTAATSSTSATCRNATTTWPAPSAMARRASCSTTTSAAWHQLGVLGLVLNAVVLWTTVYLNAALEQLKAQSYPVREEDTARLSPFVPQAPRGARNLLLCPARPGTRRHPRTPRPRRPW